MSKFTLFCFFGKFEPYIYSKQDHCELVWSNASALEPGDGWKIPDVEQFIVAGCGTKTANKTIPWQYYQVHLRLTGKKTNYIYTCISLMIVAYGQVDLSLASILSNSTDSAGRGSSGKLV